MFRIEMLYKLFILISRWLTLGDRDKGGELIPLQSAVFDTVATPTSTIKRLTLDFNGRPVFTLQLELDTSDLRTGRCSIRQAMTDPLIAVDPEQLLRAIWIAMSEPTRSLLDSTSPLKEHPEGDLLFALAGQSIRKLNNRRPAFLGPEKGLYDVTPRLQKGSPSNERASTPPPSCPSPCKPETSETEQRAGEAALRTEYGGYALPLVLEHRKGPSKHKGAASSAPDSASGVQLFALNFAAQVGNVSKTLRDLATCPEAEKEGLRLQLALQLCEVLGWIGIALTAIDKTFKTPQASAALNHLAWLWRTRHRGMPDAWSLETLKRYAALFQAEPTPEAARRVQEAPTPPPVVEPAQVTPWTHGDDTPSRPSWLTDLLKKTVDSPAVMENIREAQYLVGLTPRLIPTEARDEFAPTGTKPGALMVPTLLMPMITGRITPHQSHHLVIWIDRSTPLRPRLMVTVEELTFTGRYNRARVEMSLIDLVHKTLGVE